MKQEDTYHEIEKDSFFRKLGRNSLNIGKATTGLILTMYYAAKDKNTPKWAKTVIFGAIAYFIMPLDSIPDFLPALGFTDDVTAITTALSVVAGHITEEHKNKAREKLNKFFWD